MASECSTPMEGLSASARELVAGTPLADDMDRLLQLSVLEPEEQQRILRMHLNIGVPWEEAIGSARTPSPAPRRLGNVGDTVTVELRALRPNRINRTIFAESLSDEGIKVLVDDMRRRKLRVPIEILVDGEILDGERRCLAAAKRGDTSIVARIVAESMTDSELRAYIYDAHSTTRDVTIDERARVYQNAVKVLRERHGRPSGRPKASSRDEGLPGEEIRKLAAKQAGFLSVSAAERTVLVLKEGTDEIRNKLRDGNLTVYAAYKMLGRGDDPEVDDDDELLPPGSSPQVLSVGAVGSEITVEADLFRAASAHDSGVENDASSTPSRRGGAERQCSDTRTGSVPLLQEGNADAQGDATKHTPPAEADAGALPTSVRRTHGRRGATDSRRKAARRSAKTGSSEPRQAYEEGMAGVLQYFIHLRENEPGAAEVVRAEHIARIDAVLGDLPAHDTVGDADVGEDPTEEIDLNVEPGNPASEDRVRDLDSDEDDSDEDDSDENDSDEDDSDEDDSDEDPDMRELRELGLVRKRMQ